MHACNDSVSAESQELATAEMKLPRAYSPSKQYPIVLANSSNGAELFKGPALTHRISAAHSSALGRCSDHLPLQLTGVQSNYHSSDPPHTLIPLQRSFLPIPAASIRQQMAIHSLLE